MYNDSLRLLASFTAVKLTINGKLRCLKRFS